MKSFAFLHQPAGVDCLLHVKNFSIYKFYLKMKHISDWKLKGENIVCDFIKSKKNSNSLLELEDLLLSSDEECVLCMFPVILDLFSKVFSTGVINTSSKDDKNSNYKDWLLSRYEDFTSHLLSYMSHKNNEIQISALNTLLSLVKLESEYQRINEKDNPNFPFMLFKKIISCLASDVLNQRNVIKAFQEYTKYCDIKLYLLKAIHSLLNSSSEITDCFLENCFLLLYSMTFPKKSEFTKEVETFAYRSDSQESFQLKEKPFRKFFTSVWTCLLNYELSPEFLRKALAALNENILPHLQNPCLMTDFLTNSFNKGGVLSLLALKGLFILMDRYNLEYPDFFGKLYALMEQDIINGKFSSRFFDLTDLFLSSTHLPTHLVAAFAKRLSRLSLISSTNTIRKILRLLSNMLVNHPTLGILIHNKDAKESQTDPFNMDAVDPAKSNAVESSLWEIKVLHSHVNPEVSCRAKEFTAAYPKFQLDIEEISRMSMQDMYRKIRKRKFDSVPLALHPPPIKKRK